MPTIARMMGAALLRLSHVLPLVRVIIAPREQQAAMPPAATVGLLGLWNNFQRSTRLFGGDGWKQQQQQRGIGVGGSAWGGKVLSGLFLTTSQEWAMSDPVWYVQYLRSFLVADFLILGGGTSLDSLSFSWFVCEFFLWSV